MARAINDAYEGYIGYPKGVKTNKYMVFGDKVHEIHNVVVHTFNLGDVEDPDLYAAEPLIQWQQSEMGEWVMERAIETPMWHRMVEASSYHYKYAVSAKLKDVDYTFWTLKWGSK